MTRPARNSAPEGKNIFAKNAAVPVAQVICRITGKVVATRTTPRIIVTTPKHLKTTHASVLAFIDPPQAGVA